MEDDKPLEERDEKPTEITAVGSFRLPLPPGVQA